MNPNDLAARVQRLEDRNAVIDVVIKYATSIDDADWTSYASIFTDPVHIDFSEAGLPPADFPLKQFVGFAAMGLEGWDARQHISPNHVVEFDDDDPDTVVVHSYMYAQHYKKGAPGGEFYLMRGSYDNVLVRVGEGWKIRSVTQHVFWIEGNPDAASTEVEA